jgi:anti-anti-sigma factor
MSTGLAARLLVEPVQGVTVVNFADTVLMSEDVIEQVEEQLNALVDHAGTKNLLISFRDVRYMSSGVLGILIKLVRKVTKDGGHLRLCGLNPTLMEAFRATGMDRLIEIHEQESTALDSF